VQSRRPYWRSPRTSDWARSKEVFEAPGPVADLFFHFVLFKRRSNRDWIKNFTEQVILGELLAQQIKLRPH
jgi:hypothetical protein